MATNTATATAVAMDSRDEVDFIASKRQQQLHYTNSNSSKNNISNNNSINNNNYDELAREAAAAVTAAMATTTTTKTMDISNRNCVNVPNMQAVPKTNSASTTQSPSKTTPTTPTTATTVAERKDTTTAKEKKDFEAELQTKKPKERLSLFSSFSKRLSQKSHSHPQHVLDKPQQPERPAPFQSSKSTPLLLPPTPPVPIGTPPRQHKFVKSSSIARLLGNTYNAKKFEKEEQKRQANVGKFNTYGGRRRQGPYLERFKHVSKEDGDVAGSGSSASSGSEPVSVTGVITMTTDSSDLFGGSRSELVGKEQPDMPRQGAQSSYAGDDIGAKAMRTLTRGLGKLWWKRTHSVNISSPDPEFKVSYLGNVLTGWAKGEGCVEKQLNTLWRNYTQNNKPDVVMRVKVCASGLKATTRQHGLTEYWANRITYCCAPKNYPRVICWIYRHEGRKLKHELRCHAVLCSKEKIAIDICETLKENLESALREFKREKILKQNARLSLANAVYDNPSLPRRKIMLSVGGNNYRPPLERSKSAPKLMAIEEAIGEEEGEEIEDTNEPEMRACCQKDSLYPAMTLGRRHCRRGHSIRRTGKSRPTFVPGGGHLANGMCCANNLETKAAHEEECRSAPTSTSAIASAISDGSDSEDFEKLLKYNNYDTNASLSTELLPYFDMQLHKNTSQSLGSLTELKDVDVGDGDDEGEPLSLLPTINSDPSADPEADYDTSPVAAGDAAADVVALRRSGVCSDGEEDYLDDAEDMYFRQAAILNMLHRSSMRKMTSLALSSDENSSIETNASAQLQYRHEAQSSISSNSSGASNSAAALAAVQDASGAVQRKQLNADSDEGSISSGCETASTVTANQDDISLQYRQLQQQLSTTGGGDGHLLGVQHMHGNEYGALEDVLSANGKHGGDNASPEVDLQAMYQRLESRLQQRQNSDATTYSSSSSITLKMGTSPTASLTGLDGMLPSGTATSNSRTKRTRKHSREQRAAGDSDSECSDESGYVEFQEQRKSSAGGNGAAGKPLPPPKPMPRRLLNAAGSAV